MSTAPERDDLDAALTRLDALLERAVQRTQEQSGVRPGEDPFRGKYLAYDDVARSLATPPGSTFGVAAEPAITQGTLLGLTGAFGLSTLDLDLFLIALAPEVDLRYGRIYAYLQDDVTKRRPSVDLALSLLCGSASDKLAGRARMLPPAPLVQHRLIELAEDGPVHQPFLSRAILPDPQIARAVLGVSGLDPRLSTQATVSWPDRNLDEVPLPADERRVIATVATSAGAAALAFQGRSGAGQLAAAEALATSRRAPLLVAKPPDGDERPASFRVLVREAWMLGAVLFVDGFDAPTADDQRALLDALASHRVVAALASRDPWRPTFQEAADPPAFVSIRFRGPDFAGRRSIWQRALAARQVAVGDDDLDALASRFRLTQPQIVAAVNGAAASAVEVARGDLFAAARAGSATELGTAAVAISPRAGWADLVVPDHVRRQLHELRGWVSHRQRVIEEWGFGRRLSYGKGTSALFSGAAGTGKTLAAEIIAGELGLDLYRIDLSGVVSKYIGETEKNLDRVFAAAEDANAVLLFDEADALFGKRSEVRDSHDRYANIEISYLLQKMEAYEGLAILATNLRDNLDQAFLRRLSFVITFPFPEYEERLQIWNIVWPEATPLASDIDFDGLANDFRLSGGQIKNIALAAAFLAAPDGMVADHHIRHALRREYEKHGKSLREDQLVTDGPIRAGP